MLDTHVLHWVSAEPERLSDRARAAVEGAEDLAVAAISWYELAWLAAAERIVVDVPVRTWLEDLARLVRTLPLTPAVAERAVALPAGFPRDPADRLIYASAREAGAALVTKDTRMRMQPDSIALW